MANNSGHATIIPEPFISDFHSLHPDKVQITGAYLFRRDFMARPTVPIAIHSGYLFETSGGGVILVRGGPVCEPEDIEFRRVFLRQIIYHILRGVTREVMGRPVNRILGAIPRHFGDMIPVVQMLREKEPSGADTGHDTRLFESIVQGRGIEGLVPKPNTRTMKIADLKNPAFGDDGTLVAAADIYRTVFQYALTTTEHIPIYNLFPTASWPGVNCHSFTAAAAHATNISHFVNPHMGFAIGKNRITNQKIAEASRNPFHWRHADPFARIQTLE